MKKTISILLALVLVLSLSVPAFAEPYTTGSGTTTSEDVTATFVDGSTGEVAKSYYVNVSWEVSSSLTYTAGDTTLTWNAEEMQYESSTEEGTWTGEATVKVTITNKSNAAISATAIWNQDTAAGATAEMSFNNATVQVEDASVGVALENGAKAEAPKTATITGTISSDNVSGSISNSNAKLGNVTVSFKPAAD